MRTLDILQHAGNKRSSFKTHISRLSLASNGCNTAITSCIRCNTGSTKALFRRSYGAIKTLLRLY